MSPTIDPAVFDAAAVSAETQALNRMILEKLAALPDTWSVTPATIRAIRAAGKGTFPLPPKSERAEILAIDGPRGPIRLRVLRPEGGGTRGVYLHVHGGGWTLGAFDQQDDVLERIAGLGLVAVSVDYRLAPEDPYPRGPDDCEAAALWLVREAGRLYGTTRLTMGGESAGAHLTVVTALRLRDRHGLTPFAALNLNAGCYDLALTPSARRFGEERLILTTRDIRNFVRHFLLHGGSVDDPDISPIHADLAGMPPALFSVGTRDPLLDDSLFMAARWEAAGSPAELAVYPGGAHVFAGFASALTDACHARQDAFLGRAVA